MAIDPARPMRRNTRDAMLGGICAGIADYLGWDHTLVRVLVVILTVITWFMPGIIIYIVLWLIVPPADSADREQPPGDDAGDTGPPGG